MNKKYKYKKDALSKWLAAVYIAVVAAGFVMLYLYYDGTYFSAWFFSVFLVVIAFAVLSIPRYLLVTESAVEIHCVVEMTRILLADISSIREVEKKEVHPAVPLIGSYGFFGYYGYWLNIRKWDIFKMYASQRKNYVEITDIYEEVYIVSCRDRGAFIADVNAARKTAAKPTKA